MSQLNRSRLLFLTLSVMLVVPLVSGAFLAGRSADDEEDSFYKYLSVFTEVLRLVRNVYVEEPDLDKLMAGAMDGAADALDPFSFYVPGGAAKAFEEVDRIGRRHSGLLVLKERGVAYVVTVDAGSPAAEAGIRQGDVVAEVGDRSTREMPMWELLELLARPAGTHLKIELVRQANPIEVELELRPFDSPAPSVAEVDGYAVLRIASFSEVTAEAIESALLTLGDRPLLIDLRGVAGGDHEAAYAAVERFAAGPLGELRGRQGIIRQFESSGQPIVPSELAVLIDRGSQGAAEIFAQVLAQSSGAVLVGERSFGHAGLSERVRLSSGAFLEITRAFYTGPDGEPLNEALVPEVRIRRRRFVTEGDGEDQVLKRAIELLKERASDEARA